MAHAWLPCSKVILQLLYVAYQLQCPYGVYCAGNSLPELAAAGATEHGVAASPS
jgi:hypothetical protein